MGDFLVPRRKSLLWLFLLLLAGPVWASEALELKAGEFVLAAGAMPPGDAAPWQAQALPDPWRLNHPDAAESGWYRFRFSGAGLGGPLQAVYLPKLGLNAAVYLNGVFIGDGGPFEEPLGRNWNRPLLFLIPPGALQAGDNILHLRLRGHTYSQASLQSVFIGPENMLRPRHERDLFLRISLNQTASLIILSIGLLMLTFWWRRRQDTAYGYFGISALVWAAQSTNLYLQQAPLPTAAWEILVNSSVQVFSAALMISLLRFTAAGGRPLIPLLWFSMFASPLSQILAPPTYFLDLTAFWHLFTLFAALATLGFLIRASVAWSNRDASLLVGAIGLVVVLAGHDWLLHSQHLWLGRTHWPLDDIPLLHYTAPLVYLAVGLIMTHRFAGVLNEFEALNDQLEARVRAKHAQLEDSYARMRALETEQAVSEERERIYRDLHDDVGAKLLSLVYRAGDGENADLARSALQDLRDVVSTTAPDNLSLEALCGNWRAECERRLSDAGVSLDWRQEGAIETVHLNQPQALNLGRILREAVSNQIKHARASRAEVEVVLAEQTLSLRIRDNGIGCDKGATPGAGRGVRNMEMRAERIGAALQRNGEGGCEVVVHLPLGD